MINITLLGLMKIKLMEESFSFQIKYSDAIANPAAKKLTSNLFQ